MSEKERISVIITCYKTDEEVEESIKSFAEQEMSDRIDLVVVNDCSPFTKDDYQSIIDKYKDKINIQYMKTPENLGPGNARQYGYDRAIPKNDLVIYHDADEYYITPDGMTPFFEAVDENPDYCWYVSGYKEIFGAQDNREQLSYAENNRRISANCLRRSFLDEANVYFDPDLSFHDEDILFFHDAAMALSHDRRQFLIKDKISCVVNWKVGRIGATDAPQLTPSQVAANFILLNLKTFNSMLKEDKAQRSGNTTIAVAHLSYACEFFCENIFKEIEESRIDLKLLRKELNALRCCSLEFKGIMKEIELYVKDKNDLDDIKSAYKNPNVMGGFYDVFRDKFRSSSMYTNSEQSLDHLINVVHQLQEMFDSGEIELEEENRISIIITCYKTDEVVENSLRCFAEQEMRDRIDLIVVNDCSPFTEDEYQGVIDKYKDKINIQYLKTPKNCGPGDARQYGLDNDQFNNEFVIFHDVDEEYVVPDGLTPFFEAIDADKARRYPSFAGGYVERTEISEGVFEEEEFDGEHNIRISANCRNKNFLQDNRIRFDHDLSYHDEDAMFGQDIFTAELNNFSKRYNINDKISCVVTWELNRTGARDASHMKPSQLALQFLLLNLKRLNCANKIKRYWQEDVARAIDEAVQGMPYIISYYFNFIEGDIEDEEFDVDLLEEQIHAIKRELKFTKYILNNIERYVLNIGDTQYTREYIIDRLDEESPSGNIADMTKNIFELRTKKDNKVGSFNQEIKRLEENFEELFG